VLHPLFFRKNFSGKYQKYKKYDIFDIFESIMIISNPGLGSLKVTGNGSIRKLRTLGSVSYLHFVATAVSLAVYEIFSAKEWHDLEKWVRGCSRSLKMAPFEFDRPYDFLLIDIDHCKDSSNLI